MPDVRFDRYYRYDEITAFLRAYAEENPDLVGLESIGQSYEGREIWLVTLTDRTAGAPEDKPAFWCDGNIHASEVSASSAVLHVLDTLIRRHREGNVRTLNERTFYLVPRLGPDGAEWALETPPRIVRSSVRPYPYDEEDLYGLERKDLDGDGRILSMRVPDDNGPWKISEEEPRLMKRRDPGEVGGQYYRLMPEGLFHHFDGLTMRGRKLPQGLDMNRNFPSAWRQEHEQHGAGEFPTSEPEIRAAVHAIVSRPNICGAVTFHTYSGVHLRPPSRMPDDDIPAEDLWAFKTIGQKGTDLTGYPAISNYHEFRYHPKEVITGVFDDWMYEHRGVYAWTTEIWAPQRQAGITDYKYIDWFRDHPHADDITMLKWSDEKLDGKGYIDWKPLDHPQLGPVEIGGWDAHFAFRNPPPQFLEKEIKGFVDWVEWQANAGPLLRVRDLVVDAVGGDTYRIRLAVENAGWLPTNVTKLAKDRSLCRGVVAEIRKDGTTLTGAGTGEPSWLVAGLLRQEAGQLRGWSSVTAGGFGYQFDATDDVAVFSWVVRERGTFHVEVQHERAGRVRVPVTLPPTEA